MIMNGCGTLKRRGRFDLINYSLSTLCVMGLIFSFGCSRTVTGGFDDSPDKKFRIYGRVYGAPGKAFLDETEKTVRISVVTADANETLLFREKIDVKGSDVGWDCTWDKGDNAEIVVFTYGPNVDQADAVKAGTLSNLLATVSLTLDKSTGKFTSRSHLIK